MNFELTRRNTPEPVPENQRIVTLSDLNGLKEIQPGFFEGTGEALKDIAPNAALTTASSAFAAYDAVLGEDSLFGMNGIKEQLRNSAVEAQELGIQIQDPDKFAEEQYEGRLQSTKRMRERAKEEYTPSEAAVGTAGQMIFGVGSELTKLAMALPFGSAAPAVYGANVGISQAQALMDEGVDEDTARDAGFASALAATIGVKLPSAFGKTRMQSAVIGAGANTGLFMSEQSTIAYILNNADYGEVAKRFDSTDPVGLAINAVTGTGFGIMTFRGQRATSFTNEQRKELRDTFTAKLMETGGVNADESNARTQAELLATSTEVLAKRAGWSFDEAIKRAPNIVRDDGTLNKDAFNEVTFGYEWVYGDKAARESNLPLTVAEFDSNSSRIEGKINFNSLRNFLKQYVTSVQKKRGGEYSLVSKGPSLINRETGWTLTMSNSDAGEIAHKLIERAGDSKDILKASLVAVNNLQKVVELGYLAESYRDVKAFYGAKKKDGDLVGLHRFYTPMLVDGDLFAVKMTVKDRSKVKRAKVGDIGDVPRTALYSVESLEIKKLSPGETATVSEGRYIDGDHPSMVDDGGTASVSIAGGDNAAPTLSILQRARTTHEISVREMLTGVNRDGDAEYVKNKEEKYDKVIRSRFFDGDPVDDAFGYRNDEDDVQWQKIQRGEKLNAFNQQSQGRVLGKYSPGTNEIKLTPNANLSTFSHEMGHWYLDTLFRIVGDNVNASVLARDVDTLLREFGVKSVDAWNKLGVDGQRKYHEQFASWLEVYLSEGKAPKSSLEGVFERVKAWLVDVYKKLGGTKEAVEGRYESEFGVKLPEMSTEVKSVMDRIFAEETFADKVADKFGGLTHAVVDAARLKYYSSRFYKDQPVSEDSPVLLNKSKSAEANARERLDNGEKVEITQPIADIERMTQEQGRIVEDMQAFVKDNEEAQLELRAEQTVAENESPDMTSLAKEFEAPDGTGLQTKELDQVIEYREDGTPVTGREVIETEYAMADEVDRFADIMGEAAECVFRNNGM